MHSHGTPPTEPPPIVCTEHVSGSLRFSSALGALLRVPVGPRVGARPSSVRRRYASAANVVDASICIARCRRGLAAVDGSSGDQAADFQGASVFGRNFADRCALWAELSTGGGAVVTVRLLRRIARVTMAFS